MSIVTKTQAAEAQSMLDRYSAAVAAGQKINDARVHLMARAAKYAVDASNAGGTDTSLHSMTGKQVVEFFANSALVD